MSRRWLPMLVAAALLMAAGSARGQDEPQVLLDRAVKAHGGEAALAKFKAGHSRIRGTLAFAGNGPFTGETYYQLPSQIKNIVQFEINEKKSTVVEVLNGDRASMTVNGEAVQLNEKIVAELREGGHMLRVTRLLPLKEKAYQLSLVPAINVDGRAAAGLKVVTKGFRDVTLYFDKETCLLVKTERQVLDVGNDKFVSEERIFSDYKEVQGIKVPRKVMMLRDGKKYTEAEDYDIQVLEKLDDAIFANP